LKLANSAVAGGTNAGGYDLEQWRDYQRNFRSNNATPQNGKEIVWTSSYRTYQRWHYGEWAFSNIQGYGTYLAPTQNYVEKFGMKNGLPISDPASGYNPNDPFVNRDPRYDYSIISDRDVEVVTLKPPYDKPVSGTSSLSYKYCDLFTNGWARSAAIGSLTGYGQRKFNQRGWNGSDALWSNNNSLYQVPLVRLAQVLLEYAEAVNEAYGPNGKSLNCPLTAIDAVNKVRARVMVGPYNASSTYTHNDLYPYDFQEGGTSLPNVDPKYTTDKATFREIIRSERCVELAFEAKRWDDARRWGVASSLKYREKYEYVFDAAHTSFAKVLARTSIFEPKHWWLPFPTGQVALYPAFKQNPGW
jgi:starch-binding outer membrane protein, SusD/RagB family